MGYYNAELIRICERERRLRVMTGNSEAFWAALIAVETSQAECPHPPSDVHSDPRLLNGKSWCRRCSKIMERKR
jgi:hypothetical protein